MIQQTHYTALQSKLQNYQKLCCNPMYFLQESFLVTLDGISVVASGAIMKLQAEFYFLLLQESFSACSRREALSSPLWGTEVTLKCPESTLPLNPCITASWERLPLMGASHFEFISSKPRPFMWLLGTWSRRFPTFSEALSPKVYLIQVLWSFHFWSERWMDFRSSFHSTATDSVTVKHNEEAGKETHWSIRLRYASEGTIKCLQESKEEEREGGREGVRMKKF